MADVSRLCSMYLALSTACTAVSFQIFTDNNISHLTHCNLLIKLIQNVRLLDATSTVSQTEPGQ